MHPIFPNAVQVPARETGKIVRDKVGWTLCAFLQPYIKECPLDFYHIFVPQSCQEALLECIMCSVKEKASGHIKPSARIRMQFWVDTNGHGERKKLPPVVFTLCLPVGPGCHRAGCKNEISSPGQSVMIIEGK